MPHVMCRRNWSGVFGRTIQGVRREFPPGEPVELKDSELPFIANDLGKALLPVERDERGQWRVIDIEGIDFDALAKLRPPEPLLEFDLPTDDKPIVIQEIAPEESVSLSSLAGGSGETLRFEATLPMAPEVAVAPLETESEPATETVADHKPAEQVKPVRKPRPQ